MNSIGFVWVALALALLPLLTMQPAQRPASYDWSKTRVVVQHYDPQGYTRCMQGGSEINACVQASLLPQEQPPKETP